MVKKRRISAVLRTPDAAFTRPPGKPKMGHLGLQAKVTRGDDSSETNQERPWHAVVGIGASAGGLESLCEFFQEVPYNYLTFVVMQHLSPTSTSLLPILLQRFSQIRVVEACDGDRLLANIVYVVPPNTDIALNEGKLSVWRREEGQGHFNPIDFFFRSLAEDQGPKAVGIVLSGTGTDGTEGLKAIQANGGVTYAQDTVTARFSGMPDFASQSGFADHILSPAAIAQSLDIFSNKTKAAASPRTGVKINWMESLLERIKALTTLDLHLYKPSTMLRRIERRSRILKHANIKEYLKYALEDEKELLALSDDLVISVTRFFRDREFFRYLRTIIIPELCSESRDKEAPLRVWVTACATGQEAYSVAISFATHLRKIASTRRLQIFATDISSKSIQFARRGVYPLSMAVDMPPDLLAEFFMLDNGAYRVKPSLRKLIVFSEHNLLNDPPFSRMCLITCRNLLIYLRPKAQKQILNRLHYALLREGYLALGSSESTSEAKDLFFSREIPHKFYGKQQASRISREAVFTGQSMAKPNLYTEPHTNLKNTSISLTLEGQIIKYAHVVGLVIDEADKILEIRGDTTELLALNPGQVHLDLTSFLNDELRREAHITTTAYRKSIESSIGLARRPPSSSRSTMYAVKLLDSAYPTGVFLLIINRNQAQLVRSTQPTSRFKRTSTKADLMAELQAKEHDFALLQSDCDTMLAQNKHLSRELASAHEDSQAKMEELQSTVEELETSREEMQSANEEIMVVNEELRARMDENDMHQSDLLSVLANVDDIMLLLDKERTLKRYSQAAHKALGVDMRDLGKAILHIHRGFPTINFDAEIERVHLTRENYQADARWQQGALYRVQIISVDSSSEKWGTFIRFDALKILSLDSAFLDSTSEYTVYAEKHWAASDQAVIAFTESFEVFWANKTACKLFSLSLSEFIGERWAELKLNAMLKQRVNKIAVNPENGTDETEIFHVEMPSSAEKPRRLQAQMHRRFLPSGKSFFTLNTEEVHHES